MQENVTTPQSFEALWKLAQEEPVAVLDSGADDEIDAAAGLGAWIGQIADACLGDGLIGEAEHDELRRCGDRIGRILAAVPSDALRLRLSDHGASKPQTE